MTYIDTIKLRPKGHLVIPAELREGFKDGEELVVIRDENELILKRASAMSEEDKEDLEFARSTEEGWKEIDRGECTTMDFDDFIAELKTW